MDSHLSRMKARTGMEYSKIKPYMQYLSLKDWKTILNSKLRGQITMFLPLFINQSQGVKKQVEVLLMRINKLIYGKNYFAPRPCYFHTASFNELEANYVALLVNNTLK